MDVGIATLLNTEIQTSKSGFKTKQYLNNGVPVLSSNLPENNNVIIDGYNGFLCSSSDAFLNRLSFIYKMPESEYGVMSKAAKDSVLRFNHSNYWEKLNELYEL